MTRDTQEVYHAPCIDRSEAYIVFYPQPVLSICLSAETFSLAIAFEQ